MTNVIQLFPKPLNVSDMFDGILKLNDPNHAFVIVWNKDGSLPTYHSTTEDMSVILMRLQEFVHKYYNGDFGNAPKNNHD